MCIKVVLKISIQGYWFTLIWVFTVVLDTKAIQGEQSRLCREVKAVTKELKSQFWLRCKLLSTEAGAYAPLSQQLSLIRETIPSR